MVSMENTPALAKTHNKNCYGRQKNKRSDSLRVLSKDFQIDLKRSSMMFESTTNIINKRKKKMKYIH